jgi:hypothetical protein
MKRYPLFLALCLLSTLACRRKISRDEVKVQLEKAMTRQLEKQQPSGKPHPQFDVLDVVWFEDSTYYLCDFTVKMTLPNGRDTTGIMKKKISRDFANVE